MFRKSAQILLTTGTNFARRLGSRGSQRSLVTGTITTNNHETRYKIFSKQRYAVYQTSTLTRLNIRSHCHACWKCGQELAVTSGAEDLCPARRFFCPGEDCGVLQPVKNFNYFEVFNLPPKYDLDTKQLSQMFRQIQHRLHPDRSSGVSEVSNHYQSCATANSTFTQHSNFRKVLYITLCWSRAQMYHLCEWDVVRGWHFKNKSDFSLYLSPPKK